MLSETFSTGFVVDEPDIGEPEGGPSSQFLAGPGCRARRVGVWHLPGGPRRRRRRHAPVQQLRVRRSGWHDAPLPQDPFVRLRRRSQALPGRRLVHERHDRRRSASSPFVCYDLRFADEFWQLAHDTDVYVVPANWPAARRLHWQTLLQARAIENLAYVVGCNRVGTGGGLDYAGDSRVVDPLGELLTTAAGDETTLLATIDPERVAQVRGRFGFLDDRR